MWLTDCWVHGLRRFGGEHRHRVRIDAKVVCLIGAKETGKSTILHALELAQGSEEIPASDRTRREEVPDQLRLVELRFRLDDAHKAALSTIPRDGDGPQDIQWFYVVRAANGTHRYATEPKLIRDRELRRSIQATLAERVLTWWPEPSEPNDTIRLPVARPWPRSVCWLIWVPMAIGGNRPAPNARARCLHGRPLD
jgi:hypothetical protein